MKKVLHRSLVKSAFGGTAIATTTLCRRVDNSCDDYNVAADDSTVTCKFCLSIMHNVKRFAAATRNEITEMKP